MSSKNSKRLSYERFMDDHWEGGPSALYIVLEHYKPIGYMQFSHNSLCLLDLNTELVEVFWFKDVAAIDGALEQGEGLSMIRFPDFCRMEIRFHNGEVQPFDILNVCLFDRFAKMHDVLLALHHYMKGSGRAYWSDSDSYKKDNGL
jgi:hypothetical protein